MTLCPQCADDLVGASPYRSWCMSCDWNIEPVADTPTAAPSVRRHQRQERRIHELDRTATHRLCPPWTPLRLVTYVLALGVHVVTVAMLAAAVLVAISSVPIVPRVALTALLLGFAVATRPRLGRLDRHAPLLLRPDAPRLYALLDEVADALEAPRIHCVVVTDDVATHYDRLGPMRRPTLTIGVAMWAALSPQSKVALLAHEIAHGANHDPRRSWAVESAEASLQVWRHYLRPVGLTTPARTGGPSRLIYGPTVPRMRYDVLAMPVLLPLYSAATACRRLLVATTRSASEQAEYAADAMAVRVASRPAAVSVLERQILTDGVRFLAERSGPLPDNGQALRDELARIPIVEIERRRRVSAREFRSVDSRHPATHLRMGFVHSRPDEPALVRLSDCAVAAIDAELGRGTRFVADGRPQRAV